MSWGYWGIVGGLIALVANLFVCLSLVYSQAKGSPEAPSRITGRPAEAIKQAPVNHLHAA